MSQTTLNDFLVPIHLESNEKISIKSAFLINVYHEDILNQMKANISAVRNHGDLFFSTNTQNMKNLKYFIRKEKIDAEIIEVKNPEMDINSFIVILKQILDAKYEVLGKMHTKKGNAGLPEDRNSSHNWNFLQMNALFDNSENVSKSLSAFSQHENISLLGSASFYKSNRFFNDGNEKLLYSIIDALALDLDPLSDWGFFAGSAYYMRPSGFTDLIEFYDKFKGSQIQTELLQDQHHSIWHALERLVGAIPEYYGRDTALAFIDKQGKSLISLAKNSRTPCGNKFPVRQTIQSLRDLDSDRLHLVQKNYFDKHFYIDSYLKDTSNFDPVDHFLRYGAFEGCNPNKDFDIFWNYDEHEVLRKSSKNPYLLYIKDFDRRLKKCIFPARENISEIVKTIEKSGIFNEKKYLESNRDVFNAGVNPIEHYITYGQLEGRENNNEMFDELYYEFKYLDSRRSKVNAYIHYAVMKTAGKYKPVIERTNIEFKNYKTKNLVKKKISDFCIF